MSCLIISVMLSSLLVGVWGVLDSGSRPRYTSASALLNGVGVLGASPMFLVVVGDNLEVLGVEWAETCSSELRLGVVSMEAWPPGL